MDVARRGAPGADDAFMDPVQVMRDADGDPIVVSVAATT